MNNTLTSKEWLEKEEVYNSYIDPSKQGAKIRLIQFSEIMEKYANYKSIILEDRIKEFRERITTEYEEQGYFRDYFFSDFLLGYDKHFNIENKQ
jgi:hypothetical protein